MKENKKENINKTNANEKNIEENKKNLKARKKNYICTCNNSNSFFSYIYIFKRKLLRSKANW